MFERAVLTVSEEDSLLARTETQFFDFKSAISNSPIFKTLSSLANADGGELCVGIGDKKETNRLSSAFVDEEAANGLVSEALRMFSDGPEFISCHFLALSTGRLCLMFSILKTPFVVKCPNGDVYRRQNAQDVRVKDSELSRLQLDKGVASAEDQVSGFSVSEVLGSETLSSFISALVPLMDARRFLERERLVKEEKLTYAAALLFCDYPQPEIPHGAVKIYRYKTASAEGGREDLVDQPETIEGPIYSQIFKSVQRTKEIIDAIPVLSTSGFREIRYPPEAIHEVICNALLHRDYSINDYVHVRIFENRVEVESPGRLAGHITITNILRQRFARNKKLVRLIAKFPDPPNKDVGEGLNTTFNAMRALNLRKPEIVETSSSVMVRLQHEALASREEIIKIYLQNNQTINNTTARALCNTESDSIIRKMFAAMVAAGEIEVVPGTKARGTKYRLR